MYVVIKRKCKEHKVIFVHVKHLNECAEKLPHVTTLCLALSGEEYKLYLLPLFRAMSQVDFKTSGDREVSKEWLTLPFL